MIDEDKIDKNFFFKRLEILKNNVDMKRQMIIIEILLVLVVVKSLLILLKECQ